MVGDIQEKINRFGEVDSETVEVDENTLSQKRMLQMTQLLWVSLKEETKDEDQLHLQQK